MSATRRPAHARVDSRRWLFWLLLGAWLSAQTLGLVHRQMHGMQAHAEVGHGDAFHGGDTAADCVLYDHAGLADVAALCAAPVLPALPPGGVLAARAVVERPVPPPPSRARGPPAQA